MLFVSPWRGDSGKFLVSPLQSRPCGLSLGLVSICILSLLKKKRKQCRAFLGSVSGLSKLSNLQVVLGTLKFVASWSKVRVAPGTPELATGV